uniref:Uncharacterized protein n=1 Tax=Eutreptiella gymnastica TaxID=73025 RepID=A0A7S4GEV7_9EUGL
MCVVFNFAVQWAQFSPQPVHSDAHWQFPPQHSSHKVQIPFGKICRKPATPLVAVVPLGAYVAACAAKFSFLTTAWPTDPSAVPWALPPPAHTGPTPAWHIPHTPAAKLAPVSHATAVGWSCH